MVRYPVTVDGNLTVGQFMDEVARSRRFTTYPVVDGGRPIGLLAFGSVAALPRSEWDSRRVREAMLPLERVPLLTEDETAIDALTALSSPTSNRGLVVENEHLAGLLSITDLTRALELRRSLRPSGARPAHTAPPCRTATCRTIASPSPDPGIVRDVAAR